MVCSNIKSCPFQALLALTLSASLVVSFVHLQQLLMLIIHQKEQLIRSMLRIATQTSLMVCRLLSRILISRRAILSLVSCKRGRQGLMRILPIRASCLNISLACSPLFRISTYSSSNRSITVAVLQWLSNLRHRLKSWAPSKMAPLVSLSWRPPRKAGSKNIPKSVTNCLSILRDS